MIQMFINNEEVVSNKEFTISEEMLVASSTILNNCYPLTWEQNKDYVSNFYYPKDYSKCCIYNVNEGDIEILGETTQDGTPTPNNPIPIINKTGLINVNIGNRTYTIDLGNIELCKIGDYVDYIAGTTDNWVLYKNIEKTVISENNKDIITSFGIQNGHNRILINKESLGWETSWLSNIALLNKYKEITSTANVDTGTFATNFTKGALTIWNDSFTNLETAKELLIGTEILITKAQTQQIPITDTNLIKQLNNLKQQLLFVGIVKNSGEISLNPFDPKYCSLQILDFKTLLSEGDLLDFVILNKTVEQAIDMVIDSVSDYGFVKGNIQILNPNEIIGAYSTLNKTAYDVLQYLSDISQSKWFTRTIDENTTAIDFYDPTLLPRANNLLYTQQYWEQNNIKNVSFSYGTYDYRNKQVIISDEVYSDIATNENLLANGYSKIFNTSGNIAILNSVAVNGVEKTLATNEEKELGIDADFYYSPGTNEIESNENDPVYTAGTIISVSYISLVKGRQTVYNNDEVSRLATQLNRKGVISRYEDRNDILSSEELNKVAQTYIKYKGSAEIVLNVETLNNDLYNVGQIVYFDAPINDLKGDYLVKKKNTNIIATGNNQNIFYTYELSSSFNGETAVNWFDNQRAKTNGNIQSGDYITRNIDNETTANIIFKDLEITEIEINNNDNVLNAILDSPFTQ